MDYHQGRPCLRQTILIVEDDRLFRRSLVTYLAAFGFEIVSAASAEEALGKVAERSVDLLVTDLVLPAGSGIELVRALRARGQTVPVVLLSGYLSSGACREARDAGIDVVLNKPADLAQLETAVWNCLRGRGREHTLHMSQS